VVAYAGIDVGKRSMVVVVVAPDGTVRLSERLPMTADGADELMRCLRKVSGRHPERTQVALEDPHGPLVRRMVHSGYQVYGIHPVSSARFRERHTAGKAKDDRRDATCLAQLIRTEQQAHRKVPASSAAHDAMFLLARAQYEETVVVRQHLGRLHSLLTLYYPSALECFANLATVTARTTLMLAASPAEASRLSRPRLRSALLGAKVPGALTLPDRLLPTLRQRGLRVAPETEQAHALRLRQILHSIDVERAHTQALTEQLLTLYDNHPHAVIYKSFPALSGVLGARLLAEVGDDLNRFSSGRGLAALAGARPITRSSGDSEVVVKRFIFNRPLGHAVHMWSLQLVQRSPAAQTYYERCRERGDRFGTASRKVSAAYLGILWACLQHGEPYSEERALKRFETHDSPLRNATPTG
jgi:transposase